MPDRCPIPAEELLALYEQIGSTRKLGKHLGGYMPETVGRWLIARGIRLNRPGGNNNPTGLGGRGRKR